MRMQKLPHFNQIVNVDLITQVVAVPARWMYRSDRYVHRKYLFWGEPVREKGWSYLEPAHIRIYFPGDYYNYVESLPCKPGEVKKWRREVLEAMTGQMNSDFSEKY